MSKDIILDLNELNTLFLENDKNGVKINNLNYIKKIGKIPIVLSASHAVKQYRELMVKDNDYLTGPLAIYLADKLNCSYFVRVFNNHDDPNFPLGITINNDEDPYIMGIKSFIYDYNEQLVIDLHGCKDNKVYDCSIWSDNFKTCNKELVDLFSNSFSKYDLTVDNGSEYKGGQVTRQCALLTNSFQLEIKRKIRSLNEEDYKYLLSFLESMEESIYKISSFKKSLKLKK